MLLDNSKRDRESQAGTLAVVSAREKRFEQMLLNFVVHSATVVLEYKPHSLRVARQANPNNSAGSQTIESVGQQIENDLFHFLSVDVGDDGLGAFEFDSSIVILRKRPDHVDDRFQQRPDFSLRFLGVAQA